MSERIPRVRRRGGGGVLSSVPAPASERHWLARAQRFCRPLGRPLDERITRWNRIFFDDLEPLLRPDFVASTRAGRQMLQYLPASVR